MRTSSESESAAGTIARRVPVRRSGWSALAKTWFLGPSTSTIASLLRSSTWIR